MAAAFVSKGLAELSLQGREPPCPTADRSRPPGGSSDVTPPPLDARACHVLTDDTRTRLSAPSRSPFVFCLAAPVALPSVQSNYRVRQLGQWLSAHCFDERRVPASRAGRSSPQYDAADTHERNSQPPEVFSARERRAHPNESADGKEADPETDDGWSRHALFRSMSLSIVHCGVHTKQRAPSGALE